MPAPAVQPLGLVHLAFYSALLLVVMLGFLYCPSVLPLSAFELTPLTDNKKPH